MHHGKEDKIIKNKILNVQFNNLVPYHTFVPALPAAKKREHYGESCISVRKFHFRNLETDLGEMVYVGIHMKIVRQILV